MGSNIKIERLENRDGSYGWYFFDLDWVDECGPYNTQEEAEVAAVDYLETV